MNVLSMSNDELAAWALAEEPLESVTSFPLATVEGRRAFLHQFYWIGEEALFQAVSHVWDSLGEPREGRTIQMGLEAGTGRKGKAAIAKVLMKFLGEALASINPIPDREGYATLDEWHEASMATFHKDEADVAKLILLYSAILNGGPEEGC